jgi:hypothetical protein
LLTLMPSVTRHVVAVTEKGSLQFAHA